MIWAATAGALVLGFWLGYGSPGKYQLWIGKAASWCISMPTHKWVWKYVSRQRFPRIARLLEFLSDRYHGRLNRKHPWDANEDRAYDHGTGKHKWDFPEEIRKRCDEIEVTLWDSGFSQPGGYVPGRSHIRDLIESNNRYIRVESWFQWRMLLRDTICTLLSDQESHKRAA